MASLILSAPTFSAKVAPSNQALLTVGQVAAEFGLCANTVRSLCKAGLLETTRLGRDGWRRITRASVVAYLGLGDSFGKKKDEQGDDGQDNDRLTVIYHRKSSGVRSDLENGLDELKEYVRNRYGKEPDDCYADLASHVNWDGRKQFLRMLDMVLEGKVARIVCLYRDRLSRLPVHGMLQKIAAKFDCEIVYVHDTMDSGKDAVQEAIGDLLAFAHTVTTRIYSARAANNKRLHLPEEATAIIRKRIGEGISCQRIAKELNAKGFEQENGRGHKAPVNLNLVKKLARRMNAAAVMGGGGVGSKDTIEAFLGERTRSKGGALLPQSELFAAYVQWSERKGYAAMTRYALHKSLLAMGWRKKKCAVGTRANLKQFWAWIDVALRG